MSEAHPSPRSSAADRAALEAGIDRLGRLAKDLRQQDLAGIQDRWDPRIEALQKRINSALADVLGAGTPEYKALRAGALDASLDTGFGDRYSSEELREALRTGIEKALKNVQAARELLTQRLQAPAGAARQRPAATPGPAAAAQAPAGAAPTPSASGPASPAARAAAAPAPSSVAPAPAPAASPTPAPSVARTPAATPAPAAPAAAPVSTGKPAAPQPPAAAAPTSASATPAQGAPVPAPAPLRVAIVNRLDEASGAVVADFVTQLGMEPVAVAEPSGTADGSFIDRLEGVRGADYAVVLLPTGELDAATGSAAGLLEIGFLFGVMARRRVCFILPSQPTLPPELAGLVIHHVLDDGDLWRLLLAREMRKGGLDVDMNKAV